jgi:hypothetical protein
LAQAGLNDDGFIDLFTAGRANHAGGGDPRVLEAVKSENYAGYPPKTTKHQGEAGAVDGNDALYGLETYYSGLRRMTDAAYTSAVHFWAAVCDFHEWSAKSIIGHKEWSDYKIDPGHLDMKEFRADIQRAINFGPRPLTKPPTPNITVAIREGRQYLRSLRDITSHDGAIDRMEADVKSQINDLLDWERK